MEESNVVLLSMDLDIPNLWENKLVQNFPDSTFTIKQSFLSRKNTFSGLLKIDDGEIPKIQKFLKTNHPLVSLENFYTDSKIFYYTAPDKILSQVLNTYSYFRKRFWC